MPASIWPAKEIAAETIYISWMVVLMSGVRQFLRFPVHAQSIRLAHDFIACAIKSNIRSWKRIRNYARRQLPFFLRHAMSAKHIGGLLFLVPGKCRH